MKFRHLSTSALLSFTLITSTAVSQEGDRKGEGRKGNKPDKKDTNTWSAEEYSGLRGEKDLQVALASKGFAWITGSPADNEKLSVGKNAQFFGFVALRYQSGRAANRGSLGRAFYSIANDAQRDRMAEAVRSEKGALQEWWSVREEILTLLEDHLYTGLPINRETIYALGELFSVLQCEVAVHEARAYASLEDSLTHAQRESIRGWRDDPETAQEQGESVQVTAEGMERDGAKQLEDLYAKAFSWLTGTAEDNEIIPIGQPAQFFGFVSIRHKSGHAASRGTVAKDFFALLDEEQQGFIKQAVKTQIPIVREFLEKRHQFLEQLDMLRTNSSTFDPARVDELARAMGRLEMDSACIEAAAYRNIRVSMSDDKLAALMKMRGHYVLDESQVASLDMEQRGATLSILCSGCHGAPGRHRAGLPAPDLDGFWDRPIASSPGYEYSTALASAGSKHGGKWTPDLLDQFLAGPKRFAPGTKMEFQGLLNETDREALIQHLEASR